MVCKFLSVRKHWQIMVIILEDHELWWLRDCIDYER